LGSCPIGALQAVVASRNFDVPFNVLGVLVMAGAVCGRFVCGWLCPFGLLQDLLYRIPLIRKMKKLPGDRWLKYLRYFVLALVVVLLPLLVTDIIGQGKPWFCQYIVRPVRSWP
jgi:polyferredoxin